MAVIDEPVRGAIGDLRFLQVSGVKATQMQVRGELPLPPISRLTGLHPTQAGAGRSTFSMPVTGWLESIYGVVGAGAFALLADAPLGAAIVTGLDPGHAAATSELNLSFVRPFTPDTGNIVGRATMIHLGREVGLSAVELTDRQGRTMGYGTARCLINDMPVDPDLELPEPHLGPDDTPDPWERTAPTGGMFDLDEALHLKPLEIMRRSSPGPIEQLMGPRYGEPEEGRTSAEYTASPWFSAGAPNLYGGAIAWMAENIMGGAVFSTLGPGEIYGTLDMNVRFTRPGPIDGGPISAKASVEHRGRRLRIAEAELFSESGKMLAMATCSALVVPGGVQGLIDGVNPEVVMRG